MEVLHDDPGNEWTLLWPIRLPGASLRHLGHILATPSTQWAQQPSSGLHLQCCRHLFTSKCFSGSFSLFSLPLKPFLTSQTEPHNPTYKIEL